MTEQQTIAHQTIIDILELANAAGAVDVHLMPSRPATGVKYAPSSDPSRPPLADKELLEVFKPEGPVTEKELATMAVYLQSQRRGRSEIIKLGEPLDEEAVTSIINHLDSNDGYYSAAGARHRFSVHGVMVVFRRLLSAEEVADLEKPRSPFRSNLAEESNRE